MADDTRNLTCNINSNPKQSVGSLYSMAEEGCLRINANIRKVVYHKSLNVLLGFTHQGQVIVLDIASGTVLHETRFISSQNNSNNEAKKDETEHTVPSQRESLRKLLRSSQPDRNSSALLYSSGTSGLKCLSVAEQGTLIVAQDNLLGVRKDFGRTLLLESILQPPVAHEDDVVRLELSHNEAMLLRECLQTLDLSQSDSELGSHQTQVINVLTKHMKQYLFSVSKGSRISSNVRLLKCLTLLLVFTF